MQISGEIIEVLEYICEKFGIAIDWTGENVIPYLQELMTKYINWEISTSTVWIVVAAIIFIGGLSLTIYGFKGDNIGALIFGVIFCLIFFLVIVYQIFDIVECMTFPEKALFDYINRHIQGYLNKGGM